MYQFTNNLQQVVAEKQVINIDERKTERYKHEIRLILCQYHY